MYVQLEGLIKFACRIVPKSSCKNITYSCYIRINIIGQTNSYIARRVDDKTAETQREVRDDVYAMEQKVNERMRTLDQDVRELRKDLENKIKTILDNPLNN